MNQYVGVSTGGGIDAGAIEPLAIPAEKIKEAGALGSHILLELKPEMLERLTKYLTGRLSGGDIARGRRLQRYAKIDRLISTWQKLSPEDSQREQIEDNTGRQAALPMNLPILAAHLNDMVSYFAEAIAPVSNPFFSANGEEKYANLLAKFNRDAQSRNYFGELNRTLRSLLKYNLGGFRLCWDRGERYGKRVGEAGNHWKSIDLYNTLWDPSIRDPQKIASHGEWAASVSLENRLELVRKAASGEWVGLEDVIAKRYEGQSSVRLYREAAIEAGLTEDGQDQRTTAAKGSGAQSVNWGSYGLGLATDLGPEVDGFECVDMMCWLVPAQFGLLTEAEREQIKSAGEDPETFIELWRFDIVDGKVVDAEPATDRADFIAGEKVEIPFYLAYLTDDQLKEAQRSFMELMKGFQRFGSSMYNIYIAGMRKNVWGLTVADESVVDVSGLKKGDVAGLVTTKKAGVDVRGALQSSTVNAGVDQALQGVEQSLNLKNQFFPSQALPSQIAGIDRAVKSQVHTVVHGTVRSLRTILRVLDSTLLLPSRMGGYRNLKKFDKTGIEQVTDEDMAKFLGSGVESMEAERVSEVLWQLMYAIIQNQESMQVFQVPQILTYLGRIGNLSVDLGTFARPPAQPPANQVPVDPATGQPIAAPAQPPMA